MIAQQLLPEFDQEVTSTRKHLESVPGDKLDWTPHEKSMTMGALASHLAEIPFWVPGTLTADEYDFEPPDGEPYSPPQLDSKEAILTFFDENVANARTAIENTDDAVFMSSWAMKKAGEVLFEMPKLGVIRNFVLNHMIHHRGQMSVYLRLCDRPVPQSYGPTADDTSM